MSLTYGFYNSLSGDRKYSSPQISRLFEGIINDGVFASIGNSLAVTAGSGMTVNVGTGRAWFNNTWTDNDAAIPLTLDAAESVLNRIDAIVLEIGNASDVRANSIKIVKGTPASVPAAPTMIKTTGKYQYPLATIYVGTGVTAIAQANITSKIDTSECPFVTVVGLDALLPMWENEFDTWFAALQAQMAGDVATNLQNQITANLNVEKSDKTKYGTCATAAATAAKVVAQADFTLTAGVIFGVLFTNINSAANPTLAVNSTTAKAVYCNGVAATPTQIPKYAVFQYDGTYYQLLNPAYPPGVVPIANGGTGATTVDAAAAALGVSWGSYQAFCANVNTSALDAAFGKNNEDRIVAIGKQLAMFAWFKGASKTTYPFTNLITCNTLLYILNNTNAFNEAVGNADINALINASPYAASWLIRRDILATTGLSATTYPTPLSLLTASTPMNAILNNVALTQRVFQNRGAIDIFYQNAATVEPIIQAHATGISTLDGMSATNSVANSAMTKYYTGRSIVVKISINATEVAYMQTCAVGTNPITIASTNGVLTSYVKFVTDLSINTTGTSRPVTYHHVTLPS